MPGPRISYCCIAIGLLTLAGCTSIPTSDRIAAVGPTAPVMDAEAESSSANAAAQSESGQSVDIYRSLESGTLTALEFSENGIDNLRTDEQSAQQKLILSTALTPGPQADDLWDRLRSGFRLSNLENRPDRVAQFEKYYARHPKYFERLADRAQWFLPYILDQVEKRGMPTEIAILPAIESAFRPDATSKSNAVGMWQFIGATGRRFGLRQDWWMDARRDLVQSTRAALDYLDYLSLEFNGDWELALAAYNAGEGNIRRNIRKNQARNLPSDYAHLRLRRETSEYVPRLFAVRNILIDPEKYGIQLKPLANSQTLGVIDLKTQTDISVAASYLSLSSKQLHFLNLGYKRGVTPPNGPHILVVPIGEADNLMEKLATLSPTQRMQWAHHKVKKGEYLGKIARIHGVSVQSIVRSNSLKSNLINPGQELRIPLSTGAVQYAGPGIIADSAQVQKHLVASGDSLWKISRQYSVSLEDILKLNQLSKNTTLYPGQSIIIKP